LMNVSTFTRRQERLKQESETYLHRWKSRHGGNVGLDRTRDYMSENQIVVYQPNETMRMDVRMENETVWLTQSQMAELFGCSVDNIGLHQKNIYSVGELSRQATAEDFSVVRLEGIRRVHRTITCYNLDAIISVGYRVNSILGAENHTYGLKDGGAVTAIGMATMK